MHGMLMIMVGLTISPVGHSLGLNTLNDLREFFKTTYIKKQMGQMYKDPKNDDKLFYAEMFNPLW